MIPFIFHSILPFIIRCIYHVFLLISFVAVAEVDSFLKSHPDFLIGFDLNEKEKKRKLRSQLNNMKRTREKQKKKIEEQQDLSSPPPPPPSAPSSEFITLGHHLQPQASCPQPPQLSHVTKM